MSRTREDMKRWAALVVLCTSLLVACKGTPPPGLLGPVISSKDPNALMCGAVLVDLDNGSREVFQVCSLDDALVLSMTDRVECFRETALTQSFCRPIDE